MTHRTRFAALALALAATTTACASSPSATSTPLGPVGTAATSGSATATATGGSSAGTTNGTTNGSSTGSANGTTSHGTHRSTHGTTHRASGSASPTGDHTPYQDAAADTVPGETPTEQHTDDGAPGYVDGEGLPGETPTLQHTDDGAPGYEDSAADTVPTGEPPASQVPVLGSSATHPAGRGFGQDRPSTISLGGDPTGIVEGISWSSWGGPTAVGHGTGYYLAPGQSSSQAAPTRATVRLSDLGVCGDRRAYRTLSWSFPSKAGAGNESVVEHLSC